MGGSNFTHPAVFAGAGAPAPRLLADLSRPPLLLPLARFVWRATKRLFFTVASSFVSLAMVGVRCAMDTPSIDVAVAKFAIASTVSWQMYPLSRSVVAFWAAP